MKAEDVRRSAKEALKANPGIRKPTIVMSIADNDDSVAYVRVGMKRHTILSLSTAPIGKMFVLDVKQAIRALQFESDSIRRLTTKLE